MPSPPIFRTGTLACCDAFSGHARAPTLQQPPSLPSTLQHTVVRRVVSHAATVVRLFPRGRLSTGQLGAPTRDQRGVYPQLRCVCPKRWQRLHCSGPFGATYDSNDTPKPQRSLSDRIFDTVRPTYPTSCRLTKHTAVCPAVAVDKSRPVQASSSIH